MHLPALRNPFRALVLLLALPLLWTAPVGAVPVDVYDVGPDGEIILPFCPSDDMWMQRKAELGLLDPLAAAACLGEGSCDDPATRDASTTALMTVKVIVHVINSGTGTPPDGVVQADVDAQIAEMNADYASRNIAFNLVATRYHNDSDFYCIPAYSPSGSWYTAILAMRDRYNEDPANHLNVYVSCQNTGGLGTLLGIATFPWDPVADEARGGMWVNSRFWGAGNKTATHEAGHCLGLWHTHHGVSETSGCSDECRENVHSLTDAAADLVGDFAKDTPATPTNYNCANATGTDCNSVSWGSTQPENFMGYGPDTCVNFFSVNQSSRMHCWTRAALPGWVSAGGGGCTESAPNAPSGLSASTVSDTRIDLSWTDNSGNEDGFKIERDSGSGFSQIATVGANVTSFSNTSLSCNTAYSYRVRAYNCGGDSPYSGTASATTASCPAGAVMRVTAIDLSVATNGPWKTPSGYVTIRDQNGNPVSGASVAASWTGTTSSNQTATTGTDGRAFFQGTRSRNSTYCWTLTVTNVTLAGATYDAGLNTLTSKSVGNGCSARVIPADITSLGAGSPNPFEQTTRIAFNLAVEGPVRLAVFDIAGREVRRLADEHLSAGSHERSWDGRSASGENLAAGVYFYRLETSDGVLTQRVLKMK